MAVKGSQDMPRRVRKPTGPVPVFPDLAPDLEEAAAAFRERLGDWTDTTHDEVLVGAPTYVGMDPILDEYLAAYAAFRWPRRRLMLVDNTRDEGEYAKSIIAKVESAPGTVPGMLRHVDPSPDWGETFFRCWRVIANYAEFNGIDWVFSLETDVICEPMALDTLLNVAGYIKAPLVLHTYPFHNGRKGLYQGLGCTLIKTELLVAALEYQYPTLPSVEGSIFQLGKKVTHASLTGLLDVQHRDVPDRKWQFERIMADEQSVRIEA